MTANDARFVYGNADSKSKLRLKEFTKQLILTEDPFCKSSLEHAHEQERAEPNGTTKFEKDWRNLIRSGGDLVLGIAAEASFSVHERDIVHIGAITRSMWSR